MVRSEECGPAWGGMSSTLIAMLMSRPFCSRTEKFLETHGLCFMGKKQARTGAQSFQLIQHPIESISIDLTRLNASIDRIVFILTINEAAEKRLNFSMIQDAYIRIIDTLSDQELVSFKIDEYYANIISMTIGEIYLHNGNYSAVRASGGNQAQHGLIW